MSQFKKECKCRKGLCLSYIERDAIINAYTNDISGNPVLSDDETRRLIYITKYHNSSVERDKALDRLVKCNQGFIIAMVKMWSSGDHFLDLISEANIGLILAIRKFNLSRKTTFLTYARHWVNAYIRNYVATKQNCVNPPNANKIYHYANYIRYMFFREHGRQPSNDEIRNEIKKRYNVNVPDNRDLDKFQRYSYNEVADDEVGIIPTSSLFPEQLSENNIQDTFDNEETNMKVEVLLNNLSGRERAILEFYHGLNGYEPLTFAEIGQKFGLTTERIRQIYHSSLNKCRNNVKKDKINNK